MKPCDFSKKATNAIEKAEIKYPLFNVMIEVHLDIGVVKDEDKPEVCKVHNQRVDDINTSILKSAEFAADMWIEGALCENDELSILDLKGAEVHVIDQGILDIFYIELELKSHPSKLTLK